MTRPCGIGFEIWEKTNADGKGSATFDLTSLLGNDKKKILENLLSNPLHHTTSETVTAIWEQFKDLYSSQRSQSVY